MAISRAQLLKELLPGLNALFGMEYAKYGEEHTEIFETETSERSFEEETKLSGFGAAPVKNEGAAIAYDNAQEAFTARYTHETIAMGFSITEEAVEDNLYDSLSTRYTKALARAMAYTKQVKAAAILNTGFTGSGNPTYGDGQVLFSTAHPLVSGGTNSNRPVLRANPAPAAVRSKKSSTPSNHKASTETTPDSVTSYAWTTFWYAVAAALASTCTLYTLQSEVVCPTYEGARAAPELLLQNCTLKPAVAVESAVAVYENRKPPGVRGSAADVQVAPPAVETTAPVSTFTIAY